MTDYRDAPTPWGIPSNRFHPLVWIVGDPFIDEGTYIGGFSEVNAKGSSVRIGKNCDIASFVSINAADSHKLTIGVADSIERKNIEIGDNVFIGSHSVILGGTSIGNNSVIAAGVVLRGESIPPFSLVLAGAPMIKPGYYAR
mgnify:CR=1 FL=1